MCNRYRVSAKQIDLAKQYGFDVGKLMPEPERMPPPELFPKKAGWMIRKHEGALSPEVMKWGIPRHMKGKSGKPVVSYVTNVRNLESPFWRSTLANPHYRCLMPVTDFCEWSGEKGQSRSIGSAYRRARSSALPASGDRLLRETATPSSPANRTRW